MNSSRFPTTSVSQRVSRRPIAARLVRLVRAQPPVLIAWLFLLPLASWPARAENAADLDAIARDIDIVTARVECYGSIGISAPKLIAPELITAQSGLKNPFAFEPGLTARDHFDAAMQHVQGAQRLSDQQQLVINAGFSVQANASAAGILSDQQSRSQAQTDSYSRGQALRRAAAAKKRDAALAAIPATATSAERDAAAARAEQAYYEDLASLEASAPGTPASDTATLPDLPPPSSLARPAATSALLDAKDLGLRSAAAAPVISNRQALIEAAGDTATQGIFTVLADSAGYGRLNGKRTLLGALMVNVEPGWGTREKFIAEASIAVRFRYQEARDEVVERVYDTTLDPKLVAMIWRARPDIALRREIESLPADLALDENVAAIVEALRGLADKLAAAPWSRSFELPLAKLIGVRSNPKIAKRQVFRWEWLRHEFAGPKPEIAAPVSAAEPGRRLESASGFPTNRLWSSSGLGGGQSRAIETRDEVDCVPIPPHLAYPGKDERRPLAIAVSPMTDAQTLDFDNTIRRRYEYSLAIAGALQKIGMKTDAELFSSFAQQLQSDLAIRSQQATVTAFGESGGVFGYRVSPQLDAEFYPKNNALNSSGKLVLKRTSFPAMVMVGLDQADLTLRFQAAADAGKSAPTILEPVLAFEQSKRWLPVTRPRNGFSLFWNRPRREPIDVLFDDAKRVTKALAALKAYRQPEVSEAVESQASFLTRRIEDVAAPIIGTYSSQQLPVEFFDPIEHVPAIPKVTRLRQTQVARADLDGQGTFTVVVEGENLDRLKTAEAINGTFARVEWKSTGSETGEIVLQPDGSGWPKSGTVLFRLKDSGDQYALLTPPFSIVPVSEPTPEGPFEVTKTVSKVGDKTIETYAVAPDRGEWLEALIRRDTPAAPTTPATPAKLSPASSNHPTP